MFVVSYLGLLHGPFKTAEEAASFGTDQGDGDFCTPWTIIPIKEPTPVVINKVSVNDPAGVRRLVKAVASRRQGRV
jgi:hypothetical protein